MGPLAFTSIIWPFLFQLKRKTPSRPKAKVEEKKAAINGDDDEENNDDDEEDKEVEAPLLERTLELSGKRERKSTQRLEIQQTPTPKKTKEFEPGRGAMLGDLPRVVFYMDRPQYRDTLAVLHRIIYGGKGKKSEYKRDLKRFSGFTFDADAPEYEKKKEHVLKVYTQAQLKQLCELLDVERGGIKTEVVDRIFAFLLKPRESGVEGLPTPTRKRRSKAGTNAKKGAKKAKAAAGDKGKENGEEEEEDGDEEGEEDEEQDSDDNEEGL